MNISRSVNLVIRLDAGEYFETMTPTGKISVSVIFVSMIESESRPGLFAVPPEVTVSGSAIRKDGAPGWINRRGPLLTRSLPPHIMARLPRRAMFYGGVVR